jgi:hypothetical protein
LTKGVLAWSIAETFLFFAMPHPSRIINKTFLSIPIFFDSGNQFCTGVSRALTVNAVYSGKPFQPLGS